MIEIREVDLADDDVLAQVSGLVGRSRAEARPHAPAYDAEAHTAQLRGVETGVRQFLVAAYDAHGGRVVGAGVGWIYLRDNRDKAWLEIHVDPPARQAGVGGAVLEHLVETVGREGRSTVLMETSIPFAELETHGHRRFAEAHGFTLSNVEVVRHQSVPVAAERLDTWERRAADAMAARAAGDGSAYRIETHVDTMPAELLPSLCLLIGQLAVDAPSGDVDYEEEVIDEKRFFERYATAQACGNSIYETVAVDASGTVAAQSTISVPHARPDAFQWGTFVHRDHRGRSLGLAVKAANLRAVQDAAPHLRRIVTQNAETNRWMIAIIEELGYRRVEAAAEFVRRL